MLVPEFIVCFCGLLKQQKTHAAKSVDCGVFQLWCIKEGLARYLDKCRGKDGISQLGQAYRGKGRLEMEQAFML